MYADCTAGIGGPWTYPGSLVYSLPSSISLSAIESGGEAACFWYGCSRWSTFATIGPLDMTFCPPADYPDYCPDPPSDLLPWTVRARLCGLLTAPNGALPYRIDLWVEMESSIAGSGSWTECWSSGPVSGGPEAVYNYDYDGLLCPTSGSTYDLSTGSDNTDSVACQWASQYQTCVDLGGFETTYEIAGPTWRFSGADPWGSTVTIA